MNHYPILTAAEFIAQGTTAGAIMSIAETLASGNDGHVPQHVLAEGVRCVAREVAAITGQTLHIPAAVTNARFTSRRPKRANNDNHRNRGRRAA